MSVVEGGVGGMFALAQAFLDTCAEALATTVGGVPDLRYVSAGPPDFPGVCDSLTVQVAALTEEATGPPGPPMQTGFRHRFGRVNLVTMIALAMRCCDASENPSAATLTEEARKTYEDGWAMWNVMTQAIKAGTFAAFCVDVHFETGQPVARMGGLVGWQFPVRAELGGYGATP